jgi:hypothetical protein
MAQIAYHADKLDRQYVKRFFGLSKYLVKNGTVESVPSFSLKPRLLHK